MSPGVDAPASGTPTLTVALVLFRWAIAIALSARAIVVATRALRQPAMPAGRRAIYVVIALVTIAASLALALGTLGRPSAAPHGSAG